MRRSGTILLFAGAVMLCCSHAAQTLADGPHPPDLLMFSGSDLSSGSAFAHIGMRYAVTGDLDSSGIIAELMFGHGTYRYSNGRATLGFVDGAAIVAHAAAGYQFRLPNAGLALLVGAAYQRHELSDFDPANPVQGRDIGALLIADAWMKPLDPVLLSAYASQSTAFASGYARLRAGIDVPFRKNWRIGPEIAFAHNEDYRQVRLGAFVEGPYFRIVHIGASGGYYRGRDNNDGLYLGASSWRKF